MQPRKAVWVQVEVTVLPPQDGPPRKRSVGRRYSNFVTLYQRLREELGPRMLAGLEPPPKRAFAGVNKKPELIEQRRWELEQWLWRLTEVPQIANSAMMFHFCELDILSKHRSAGAQAPASPSIPSTSPSGLWDGERSSGALPAYEPSWSGSEPLDQQLDTLDSTGSTAAAAAELRGSAPGLEHTRPTSANSQGMSYFPTSNPPQQQQQQHQQQVGGGGAGWAVRSSSGTDVSPQPWDGLTPALSPAASMTAAAAHAGSGDLLANLGGKARLGLQIEYRATVSGLAKALRSQLEAAAGDLQDAVHEIHGDQEAIAQLAAQVQRLNGGTGGASAGSAAAQASGTELQAARARIAALEAELLQERRNREAGLAAQLPASQAEPAAQQHGRAAEVAQPSLEGAQERAAQCPSCTSAGSTPQQGSEAEPPSMQLQQQAALLAALQQQLAEAAAARDELQGRVKEAEELAARASTDREAALSKGRADLKVLAKEVKSLRQQLAAEQRRSAEVTAAAGEPGGAEIESGAAGLPGLSASEVTALLEEVSALQAALAACRVDMPAPLTGRPQGVQELHAPLGLLRDCSRRLSSLSGKKAGSTGGAGEPAAAPAAGLRDAFGGLLLDAAEARRRYCELLRSTLAVSAHLEGLEHKVGTPTSSPSRTYHNTAPGGSRPEEASTGEGAAAHGAGDQQAAAEQPGNGAGAGGGPG
ncbi:hypothetical protein N2152v2_000689 [Parachlorella kessleri]